MCIQAEPDEYAIGNVACETSDNGHGVVDSSMPAVKQVSEFTSDDFVTQDIYI